MPNTTDHPGHGTTTLALTTTTEDGGKIHQTWDICSCSAQGLRERLGEPHTEGYTDAATARALAEAALNTPGNTVL